jgi:hypothetical protein
MRVPVRRAARVTGTVTVFIIVNEKGGADCATGCGKCGDEVTPSKASNSPVQISRVRTATRRN